MGLLDFFRKKNEIQKDAFGSFSITNYSSNKDDITEEQALSIPTVTNCVDLICASVSQLPIYLYEAQEDGSVKKIEGDPRVEILNENPNDLLNGYNFKKFLTKEYLFYGASYIYVERDLNTIKGLYLLETKNIQVKKYQQGHKFDGKILYTAGAGQYEYVPEDLLMILKDSFDGVTSRGILELNSNTLKLALEELTYSKTIVENGAIPSGILYTDGKLSEISAENLKEDWQRLYGGAHNAGKTPVLEGGLKYQQISMKPNDLDLVNSKKSTVSEICKLFNVPESMINAYANKYASNEANGIQFLQYCMAPVLTAIEAGLNNCLLLEKEKRGDFFFRFDVSELLRTTERDKIETVSKAFESRLFSRNEAREKLGLPKLENDSFIYKLGDVFYNAETNTLTVANTGISIDMNDIKTEEQVLQMKANVEKDKMKFQHDLDKEMQDSQQDESNNKNDNNKKDGGVPPNDNGEKKPSTGSKGN